MKPIPAKEFAEIVAYHVERAFALSVEVRAPRAMLEPRARAALDRALALGERARRRQDIGLIQVFAHTATAALAALGDAASAQDRVAVALLSADERRLVSSYREALDAYTEAVRIAGTIGRTDLAAQAHLGAATTLVWSAGSAEDFRDFREHADTAARLFQDIGDSGGEIEAGIIRLEVLWGNGQVEELLVRGRALRERAREIGDDARELLICGRLVPAALNHGQLELSDEYQARTDELVAKLSARVPPWARTTVCSRLRRAGDTDAALRCNEELEQVARRELDPLLFMSRYRSTGEILAVEYRRYEEARPFVELGLELSVRIGEQWSRAELTGTRAIIVAAAGDLARAEQLLADGTDHASRGDVFAAAWIVYCRARVEEIAGRKSEADVAYRQAAAAFEASGFGTTIWSALALLDHADFLASDGRSAEAAPLLAAAEAKLGLQTGQRAARLARMREALTDKRSDARTPTS